MLRATAVAHDADTSFDIVVLDHAERHLRRKVLTLQHGDTVLVDLPEPVHLVHGDRLMLEDGRNVEVIAAEEHLIEARAGDARGIAALAWHIGNRHLPAQIETDRILIAYDRVIRDMLVGLGAEVRDVREPFEPEHGAYHGASSHGHAHGHSHGHAKEHHHGHHHHDHEA